MKLRKFKRFLISLLEDSEAVSLAIPKEVPPLDENWRNRTQLNIYHATGGKIIETVKVDKKTHDRVHSLYIIDEDEDFHQSLAHIITMDSLK